MIEFVLGLVITVIILLLLWSLVAGTVFFYVFGINVLIFFLYGFDKWAAVTKHQRVPERILWFICFLGGSAGSIIGMLIFQHKTLKKEFFIPVVILFIVQQLILLICI